MEPVRSRASGFYSDSRVSAHSDDKDGNSPQGQRDWGAYRAFQSCKHHFCRYSPPPSPRLRGSGKWVRPETSLPDKNSHHSSLTLPCHSPALHHVLLHQLLVLEQRRQQHRAEITLILTGLQKQQHVLVMRVVQPPTGLDVPFLHLLQFSARLS